VLASLAFAGHGVPQPVPMRQVQDSLQAEDWKSFTRSELLSEALRAPSIVKPMTALSTLFLGLSPASGFVHQVTSIAGESNRVQVLRQPTRCCRGVRMLGRVYDVVIIGGGPVGVSAAVKASSLGKKAILVDGTPPKQVSFTGPTGLFSKALRDASQRIDVKVLRNMAIGDVAIWAQVNELIQSIVGKCGEDNAALLKRSRVPNLRGFGRLAEPDEGGGLCTVQVDYTKSGGGSEKISSHKVLLATGSRAVRLSCLGDMYEPKPPQTLRVFDSDSIKQLAFLPRSVAIVGGGIIAVEFARIFAALSARVTMIIRAKDIPTSLARVGIDRDIGLELQNDLQAAGVKLLFETEVQSAQYVDDKSKTSKSRNGEEKAKPPLQITLVKKDGDGRPMQLFSDMLFTATGRSACSESLDIRRIGGDCSLCKNGDVVTGADLRTVLPGVYAAGDLIGAPQLASTGIKQAEAAIMAMFNEGKAMGNEEGCSPRELLSDTARYPVGIWTIPEVAFVGLTMDAAEARNISVVEGTAKYADSIRGHVHAQTTERGGTRQLKLVVERAPPHRVIGVHIFGDDACELIHYGTTLVQGGKTLADTLALTYTAVTFHELFRLAALDAFDTIERDEWRRVYEVAIADDTGVKMDPKVVTARLLAAGADSTGAENAASLFRKRRYRAQEDFVKFAMRWGDSAGILPAEGTTPFAKTPATANWMSSLLSR